MLQLKLFLLLQSQRKRRKRVKRLALYYDQKKKAVIIYVKHQLAYRVPPSSFDALSDFDFLFF